MRGRSYPRPASSSHPAGLRIRLVGQEPTLASKLLTPCRIENRACEAGAIPGNKHLSTLPVSKYDWSGRVEPGQQAFRPLPILHWHSFSTHFSALILNNLFFYFLAIIRGHSCMAYCVDPRILGHEANVLEKVQKKQVYLKKYRDIDFVNAVGGPPQHRGREDRHRKEKR